MQINFGVVMNEAMGEEVKITVIATGFERESLPTIERRRLLVPVPFALMKFQAAFLQFLPKPPITPDQVELLKRDNVVSDDARRDGRTLEGLGIAPETIGAIVPSYLWRFRKTGQFSAHAV